MYGRSLKKVIEGKTNSGKAVIILGPRQVGKTTLIQNILGTHPYLFFNGDDPKTRSLLKEPSTEQIRAIIGNHETIFIDEAQRIENIGLTMKIITDVFPGKQLFASGSSSFDLSNKKTSH